MKNPISWLVNVLVPSSKSLLLLAAAIIIVPLSGCNQEDGNLELGLLTGTISIGPLCPVETFPPDPNCQPTDATFKTWPIGVWTADKKSKLGILEPNLDGSFNFDLPEGDYFIDLELEHLFGTTLPETIKIEADKTVFLEIVIDTGIR
ncbi:MAG: hypothetical protein GY931_18030 [Maribacter sp.]|nr:hypothetical protein [Maribacter sp.]